MERTQNIALRERVCVLFVYLPHVAFIVIHDQCRFGFLVGPLPLLVGRALQWRKLGNPLGKKVKFVACFIGENEKESNCCGFHDALL